VKQKLNGRSAVNSETKFGACSCISYRRKSVLESLMHHSDASYQASSFSAFFISFNSFPIGIHCINVNARE